LVKIVYNSTLLCLIERGLLVGAYYFSTIAQLVERMTVNHDATGSSPVGGVKK
jgi:hypothetical protein